MPSLSVIDLRTLLLLLIAGAVVALGCSLLLAPVRDPDAGLESAPGLPGAGTTWAKLLGLLVALVGVAAGVALIWPGLDRVTAGAAMGMSVILFALGMWTRRGRRSGVGDSGPRPRPGILLTGTGIATAAMILAVGLAGRFA